jgi:starvation-inducible outer membrane lipoprotein
MRKLIILASALSLTACTTTPEGKHQIDAKMVVGTVALIAVAGYLGKENQKSKCANNRAGFWQDHSTGKIYTCP